MTDKDNFEEFIEWLERHAKHKEELYDGHNSKVTLDEFLRYSTEELGEVSAAITRERWELALAECIDLAHCAFLLYNKIKNDRGKQ